MTNNNFYPPLPTGWTEDFHPIDIHKDVLAWCSFINKHIDYYFRWWFPWFLRPWVIRHERGHSYGIKDCLSRDKTCVMYEDNDTWWGKIKLAPFWLFGKGHYCNSCDYFIKKQI